MKNKVLLNLYRSMYRIRAIEEEISERYSQGRMRCPTHLSVGQEAVPAAFSEIVSKNDFTVSSHRGHAHYLAKGGNLDGMMAELFGKIGGCARGKAGSMHLVDIKKHILGASAVVGTTIPVALGYALALKREAKGRIISIFF